MNAEQVKEKLNAVYSSEHDYAVIFSGKSSKLINGLYKPYTKTIETLGIRLRQIINEIQQYNGQPQIMETSKKNKQQEHGYER